MERVRGYFSRAAVSVLGVVVGSLVSVAVSHAHSHVRVEPIQPILRNQSSDYQKIKLGEMLFRDTRLSGDDTLSCASCHDLNKGGADGQPMSTGINGAVGSVNAPTVFNTAFNIGQFWDGRSSDLVEQVAGPVHNPMEMGSNWPEVIAKLSKDGEMIRAFRRVYGGEITGARIQDSISAFEANLLTPNSRFDKFLQGEENALSGDERKGYQLFKSYGCAACHQGANVGGNMYQKMGTVRDYFADRGDTTDADLGRYNVTGDEEDRHVFKVPSLRMVVLTAPYFHDGSAVTIEEAIETMAKYQLGRSLPKEDVQLIVAFLKSLVGVYRPVAP